MKCSACGNASRSRAQRHRIALGILWLLYGVGSLLARQQTIAIALQTMGLPQDLGSLLFGMHGFAAFMPYLAELAFIISILAIVTGAALLINQSLSRVLAILTALLSLLKFPLGILLGFYALWVLLPEDKTDEEDANDGDVSR